MKDKKPRLKNPNVTQISISLQKDLVKDIYNKTKKYDEVLILQSSTNIDRVVSMYKAMKKSKKIFIEDIFTANITTLLSKKGYTIPNPRTFYDVYSFIPMNRSEYRKDHKTDFYYQYIEPFKKDAHLVMTKEKFGILVKQSMLKDIKLYYNKGYLKNTCLIYSMWEGYKEKEDTNRFEIKLIFSYDSFNKPGKEFMVNTVYMDKDTFKAKKLQVGQLVETLHNRSNDVLYRIKQIL